jgi:hypothetical protein
LIYKVTNLKFRKTKSSLLTVQLLNTRHKRFQHHLLHETALSASFLPLWLQPSGDSLPLDRGRNSHNLNDNKNFSTVVSSRLANLQFPRGIAFDNLGNMYISEKPYVRKVDLDGVISTIAGNVSFGNTVGSW